MAQSVKAKKKRGKYGFVQKRNVLIDYQFDEVEEHWKKGWLVRKGDQWGMVEKSGNLTLECAYDTLYWYGKDYLMAKQNGLQGVLNLDGSPYLEIKYGRIDHMTDSTALVKMDQQWGILDLATRQFTPKDMDGLIFGGPDQFPFYAEGMTPQDTRSDSLEVGQRNMLMKVYKTLRYPPEARNNGVEGAVVIQFIVDKTGQLSDFKLIKDIGAGCGEESLRVIKMLERFEPGRQDGVPVTTRYAMPVKFRLH